MSAHAFSLAVASCAVARPIRIFLANERPPLGLAVPAFALEVIDSGRPIQPNHDIFGAMLLRWLLCWKLRLCKTRRRERGGE
jgi:hypothetical protein